MQGNTKKENTLLDNTGENVTNQLIHYFLSQLIHYLIQFLMQLIN